MKIKKYDNRPKGEYTVSTVPDMMLVIVSNVKASFSLFELNAFATPSGRTALVDSITKQLMTQLVTTG